MKIIFIIAGILVLAAATLLILQKINSRSVSATVAADRIQSLITSEVKKNKNVSGAVILIDSPFYKINRSFSAGTAGGIDVSPDQPFHSASVGKAFTATIIGTLVEDGSLDLNDKIAGLLPAGTIQGLFVVGEQDYSREVTVAQLLAHTSGAADYFDDPVKGTEPIKNLVIEQPDRFWTPQDLLSFSRDYQIPAGTPGKQFHYSDTGYILLGLIIEAVSGSAFHEVLHERIFNPLKMNDSYLMYYSEPVNTKRPISDIWFDGTQASGFTSVSIDWAGGGIISTAADLSVFIRALNRHELISEKTLSTLYSFDNKFMRGIHYGMGFMEYHFDEYFPTLKSLPNMKGHMGVLGTQMFYDNTTDTVYISSFGSTDYSAGSVQTMIKVLSLALRIQG
jgi:D-alanyl-D-alanine carboxypeptidase